MIIKSHPLVNSTMAKNTIIKVYILSAQSSYYSKRKKKEKINIFFYNVRIDFLNSFLTPYYFCVW